MTLFIKPRPNQGGLESDLFAVAVEQAAQHGHHRRAIAPILIMIELSSSDPAQTQWRAGEALAVAIASDIRVCLRTTDNVYSCDSDKIAILLSGTTIREAVCLAERLRRQLEQFSDSHAASNLLAAIGVAQLRHPESDQNWIDRAAAMCAQAGMMGRSWVSFDAIQEQILQVDEDIVSSAHKSQHSYNWSAVGA